MNFPDLEVDPLLIDDCRRLAAAIARPIVEQARRQSTVGIERATLRLMGVDGVDANEVPLPNIVVENLQETGSLARGAAYWLASTMLQHRLSAQQVAAAVADDRLDPATAPPSDEEVMALGRKTARAVLQDLYRRRQARRLLQQKLGQPPKPWKYLIVASGNIYEDVSQAVAAVHQGADIIAVIRSTGQSLLDYVPHGPTTHGTGGTYATAANFRLMRQALDAAGMEVGRYIQLTNYASGLCMPEITALAVQEGLDMLLNDAMYGILFRDINMQRTLLDQFFSRRLNACAGIIINTGEDNYLTTADAYEEGHTVLTSQFINERFALEAGMAPCLMGLGHAMEIDPFREDAFLAEIAMALLVRHIFPEAPLKYMPPTKHMTGNTFLGYAHNVLFNLITIITGQEIQLLGIMTEALHTPLLSDRYLSLQSANYIYTTARHLGEELMFRPGGHIQRRAREVLAQTHAQLRAVADRGLMKAIEEKAFAQVSRSSSGGRGLSGVFDRAAAYFNPVEEELVSGASSVVPG